MNYKEYKDLESKLWSQLDKCGVSECRYDMDLKNASSVIDEIYSHVMIEILSGIYNGNAEIWMKELREQDEA